MAARKINILLLTIATYDHAIDLLSGAVSKVSADTGALTRANSLRKHMMENVNTVLSEDEKMELANLQVFVEGHSGDSHH